MHPTTSLGALNFALAGAREGFGPFLGVYLQQRGFDPAATGFAMGLAGLAGLLATTPVGALIDRTEYKRAALALAVFAIAAGAVALVSTDNLWLIGSAQLVIGVADTSIAPLVAALTLGIVGQQAYGHRVSRNEAFNHAGNAANAALSGALGYAFGLGYVSIAIVVMAVASCGVLLTIDKSCIDHGAARGGEQDERSTLRVLFGTKPLLILAATVFAYQTANGAMLPFLAQARTAAGADPSLTTGVMTVVSQATMVGAALLAARVAKRRGHPVVFSVALCLVVARGTLAAFATSWWLVIPWDCPVSVDGYGAWLTRVS
uniref:MFS transporter n=1 Tax=uncultured Methylobacterium sp. TaxID=157278 RepID=UPI0026322648